MLIAYHGTVTKAAILKQLQRHAKLDEIEKGYYWSNGKGCAVGCTIHSGQHVEYEKRFGIPQMLACLEDCIFEGLPNGTAKAWPVRFMSAVQPGTDLSRVGWKFLHWLLTNPKVNPSIDHPLVRGAIKQCADVLIPLTKGLPVDWSAASVARSVASAAWSTARSAERSAESAASAASAESAASVVRIAANAAWSAARSAESPAWSAANAAWSAESAARSAENVSRSVANAARSVARSAAYIKMANKLIALIKAAPPAVSGGQKTKVGRVG